MVKALDKLIEIIGAHISKYYVKIMNILKLVKEDPALREVGFSLWMTYIQHLPFEEFGKQNQLGSVLSDIIVELDSYSPKVSQCEVVVGLTCD